ncbi:hypothetical protein [Nisaea sp.]|uniref:hypothetical protein n=1 Tax=Nisaea sp. TaxID=2024842 RepID=UPI0032632A5E
MVKPRPPFVRTGAVGTGIRPLHGSRARRENRLVSLAGKTDLLALPLMPRQHR